MTEQIKISILGYNVYAGSRDFFSDGVTGVVDTVNPHSYVQARNDSSFAQALKSADWLIPDGVGIKYAAKILCGKKIEKIAGSDLHDIIINSLDKKGGSCFYLGSSDETVTRIREKLAREHPRIRAGAFSPPFRESFSEAESNRMINAVNSFSPDVLFVGMTAPKQEKWVYANKDRINARLVCSIGAVFDFYAGTVRRPGRIWIRLGLEWFPRFIREPRRLWKRNLVSTPLFLWHVFVEKTKIVFTETTPKDD